MSFYKKQGSGVSHGMTDQDNASKKASKASDGILPSKKSGPVNRKTGTAGHALTNQGAAPKATKGSDGVNFQDGHMNTAMSDGGRSGPASGKSFNKKFATSEMSQAIRKRGKKPNWSDLGSG